MAAAKKSSGGWGGFLFVAFIAAIAYAPALAAVVVVAGVVWLVFASNAKFNIGNNPALMHAGQRGNVEVLIATRSQVRSRSGNGPWQHTWTIVLMAQPPQTAGFKITTYRKISERQSGPALGDRYNAWFDAANPQKFHIDWAYSAASVTEPARPQKQVEEDSASVKRAQAYSQAHAKVSRIDDESASVKRAQAYSQAHAKVQPRRIDAPASYLPADSNDPPPPLVEADGGYGFDFDRQGVDGRARIEDFAHIEEDGSTEMALTVMPRGGHHPYRTVVTTFVPYDRKFTIARGHSVRVKIDPSKPGRLMIVT